MSLNLEICDTINKKAGNTPREAAIHIVRLVNVNNMNVAMLALTLLDNCVKNCGYPFHLQISTKEFLNELVRKFSERPPPIPNPVQQRILYLIKEWKVTIAENSRHKQDLVHIKDMYRLLRFKGYRFPGLKDESIHALAPTENLKSPEELEEEDRVAQSAKLQELIRRGRPQDLLEANELMKVMTGYDQRKKPNYKLEVKQELDRIKEKVILLGEMLDNIGPNDNLERDETIQELKTSCHNTQSKLQRWVSEEHENTDIDTLLSINDMINNVMRKYDDVKKGVYDTHYDLSGPDTSMGRTNGDAVKAQPSSLIDFDGDFATGNGSGANAGKATSGSNPNATSQGSLIDDLLGLSFSENNNLPFGMGGSISLGSQTATAPVSPKIDSPPLYTPQASTASSMVSSSNPLDDLLGSTQSSNQRIPTPQMSNTASPPMNSRSFTPTNDSGTLQDPIELLNRNGLRIVCTPSKRGNLTNLKASFSNLSQAEMTNLKFMVAVPKSMQLKMDPQTSSVVPPSTADAASQTLHITNPTKDRIRIRFKVTYQQHGVDMVQDGEHTFTQV
ncbi:hypothetical protein BZG36_01859 [Bifiguratus adelaidae]|uniref:VHS domain-containing protein n=1 Tax=Bifiguratus adelaidae TaxID=1938954 RepID=A0A261Y2H7_9FUNG|nr:hypothetical protein BZG36_01859 [Bifiguratus adelaidae]